MYSTVSLHLSCVFLYTLTQKQPSVSVLGMKRSNIITIALSSLPPPRLLPPAIYSMDSSVLDRDDVQVYSTAEVMSGRIRASAFCLTFKVG